jgi:hypothetical protein
MEHNEMSASADLSKYFQDTDGENDFDKICVVTPPDDESTPSIAAVNQELNAEQDIDITLEPEETPEPEPEKVPQLNKLVPNFGQTPIMMSCVGSLAKLDGPSNSSLLIPADGVGLSINSEEEEDEEAVLNTSSGGDEDAPISFTARREIGQVAEEVAAAPKSLVAKRDSEPKVFKFQDGLSTEASVFDDIIVQVRKRWS